MRNTAVIFTLLIILAVGSAQVKTLTDVIAADPSFSTLYKLLQTTGLDYTLSQPTSYTVFAPNNTAFDALPSATLSALLKRENVDLLQSILLYHVSILIMLCDFFQRISSFLNEIFLEFLIDVILFGRSFLAHFTRINLHHIQTPP